MTANQQAPLHIVFVCTGNICRSPMAEVIVQDHLEREGLDAKVRTSSCGIGGWHIGQSADSRALAELSRAGYDGSAHRASQLGEEHADADLLIAMDLGHKDSLIDAGFAPERIRLMRSFDENSPSDAVVEDPYHGDESEFTRTREEIESALPGLLTWIRNQQDS